MPKPPRFAVVAKLYIGPFTFLRGDMTVTTDNMKIFRSYVLSERLL